jgi:hypothetical protein
MKLGARLRTLAASLRPLAHQKTWRDHLKQRDELRQALERMWQDYVDKGPPPPPTEEDLARWAREDEDLRQRDPAAWRARQEVRAKLEAMAARGDRSRLGVLVRAYGGGEETE